MADKPSQTRRRESVTITLAGREIEVNRLPLRQDKAWRERIDALMQLLMGSMDGLDFGSDGALLRSILAMPHLAFQIADEAFDLLYEYPQIAAHRDEIDAHLDSYEELLTAFLEVINLSVPLDRLWARAMETWQQIQTLSSERGSSVAPTGTNSDSANGAHGTTNSTTSSEPNSPNRISVVNG